MFLTVLKSKIHRARVTDANVNYEGSIALDPKLMREADISEFEQVHIYNVTNGERLITYAIKGKTGDVCINGAAAKKANIGDIIIIAAYASIDARDFGFIHPKIVYMEEAINAGQ